MISSSKRIREDGRYDPHDECQECCYFYRHVLNRVLKQEIPRSVRFSKENMTIRTPEDRLLTELNFPILDGTVQGRAGVLRLVECSWRKVLLLPIFPVYSNRPFPRLEYLAKLTLWENLRKRFAAGECDFGIFSLPLPKAMQKDLQWFMAMEEHSIRKHLCMKFREVLSSTDYLQEKFVL